MGQVFGELLGALEASVAAACRTEQQWPAQVAESELIFRDEYWPDFSRASLEECLAEYARRVERRKRAQGVPGSGPLGR